ncbi:hypothetical protein SKAU_G00059890 [Synaphobranchus kaupii]|uniref:Protein POLR1D n=1 Tax=Synaphobranchus kaupii TaxID=118154 RepID=A0A9Q1G4M9_SYNKA|nr:hypothetical protein SKAU_G00059890 [Synaphobranchus kaupii]
MAEEQDLERKAVEELLREAARARVRAETMGPSGWARCPLQSTNKRFLLNTLQKTTMQHCSERTGSSQSETRRPSDGRQTTEPRFRRPQRVQPSDEIRSRSPVKTQNSHQQDPLTEKHTYTDPPQQQTHTPHRPKS